MCVVLFKHIPGTRNIFDAIVFIAHIYGCQAGYFVKPAIGKVNTAEMVPKIRKSSYKNHPSQNAPLAIV